MEKKTVRVGINMHNFWDNEHDGADINSYVTLEVPSDIDTEKMLDELENRFRNYSDVHEPTCLYDVSYEYLVQVADAYMKEIGGTAEWYQGSNRTINVYGSRDPEEMFNEGEE